MIVMLHVIESLSDFGGTPKKLLYLSKYSDPKRCKLVFFCYRPSPLQQEFESNGAKVYCFDTISPVELIKKIVFTARLVKADVICTHFARPLITGFLAGKFCGIPLIHNEHSSVNYRKGFILNVITKFCLSRIILVICNSKYTLNSIRSKYSLPADKMKVLYPPVEARAEALSPQVTRNQLKFADHDIVIGHTGGMIPARDQITLIKAFARIHTEWPSTRLIIIGDGPLRESLETFVCQLGLEDAVLFTGYTDRIGDYLRIMDIYINPTLDEGFGIAVVEAMLAKLPVILADKGAHLELITDGETGFFYTGGNDRSLEEVVRFLILNPEKRAEVGARAQRQATALFSPPFFATGYIDIVESVLTQLKR